MIRSRWACQNHWVIQHANLLKSFLNHVQKERLSLQCVKNINLILVYKKDSKNLIKNYRPISLLPIYGKAFKCLLLNIQKQNRVSSYILHVIKILNKRKQSLV